MLKAVLFRTVIYLMGKLPLPALRFIGQLLGTLSWLTRSRTWLVTQENINLCYPELDAHRRFVLSKESLRETGKTMLETTYAWNRSTQKVMSKIHTIKGEDLVQQTPTNQGIVFVIPHQGNWEVINHYLGHHYGLTHMFAPNQNERLSEYIQRRRSLTGTQFVPAGAKGIRAQLKILRQGGRIGVMPDQEPLVHTGRFAPFFKIPALTNELLRGYVRNDVKVFIAVCVREADGFAIQFDPFITDLNPNAESDVLEHLNSAIETAIRRRPEQYLWSYKRFRTRPDGELDFYQFDRHPLRTWIEAGLLALYSSALRWLPTKFVGHAARLLHAIPLLAKKRKKITQINLKLTQQIDSIASQSMVSTFERALEAPRIWQCSPSTFDQLVSASAEPGFDTGAVVLTPPLGSRETTIRYLANLAHVTEYYHSNSITSLDRMIRHFRTSCGIRLVEHDDAGRQLLKQSIINGDIVTLCPDQQPRLRGGTFVPFFGVPALTTNALPELLRETKAKLLIGYAIRCHGQYQVTLKSIDYDPNACDEQLLLLVNQTLENEINATPAEYRWSDKRFNIQPIGHKKVYR